MSRVCWVLLNHQMASSAWFIQQSHFTSSKWLFSLGKVIWWNGLFPVHQNLIWRISGCPSLLLEKEKPTSILTHPCPWKGARLSVLSIKNGVTLDPGLIQCHPQLEYHSKTKKILRESNFYWRCLKRTEWEAITRHISQRSVFWILCTLEFEFGIWILEFLSPKESHAWGPAPISLSLPKL